MSKEFEFPINDGVDVTAVLDRAKGEARKTGIVIEGDSTSGRFRGTAEGSYTVVGDTLRVAVTNKPSFVPWKMIESAMRKVFS